MKHRGGCRARRAESPLPGGMLLILVLLLMTSVSSPSLSQPGSAGSAGVPHPPLSLEGKGRILYLEGKVEVKERGAWRLAREEEELPPGALLRTGESGKAILLVDGRVSVRLGSNSQASFKPEERGGLRISIPIGEFWIQVQRFFGGGAVHVETPTAVAAVKGTIVHGEVSKGGDFQVMVDEGEVEVQTRKGSWQASGGEGVESRGEEIRKIQLQFTRFALWSLQKGVEIENRKLIHSLFKLVFPVVVVHKQEDAIVIAPAQILQEIRERDPEIWKHPLQVAKILKEVARPVPLHLIHVVKDGVELPPEEIQEHDKGLFFAPARILFVGETEKNKEALRQLARRLIEHLSARVIEGTVRGKEGENALLVVGGQEITLPVGKDARILPPGARVEPGDEGFFLVKEGAIRLFLKRPH